MHSLQMTSCLNCGGAIFYGSGTIGWGGQYCQCGPGAKPAQQPDGTHNNQGSLYQNGIGSLPTGGGILGPSIDTRLEQLITRIDKLIEILEKK